MGTEITGLDTGCWRDEDSTKARILSFIGVSSKSSDSFDSELTNGIGTSDGDTAVAAIEAGGVAADVVMALGVAAAVPI